MSIAGISIPDIQVLFAFEEFSETVMNEIGCNVLGEEEWEAVEVKMIKFEAVGLEL